jgi:hypothetical protein
MPIAPISPELEMRMADLKTEALFHLPKNDTRSATVCIDNL